jgi:hypothetical protein
MAEVGEGTGSATSEMERHMVQHVFARRRRGQLFWKRIGVAIALTVGLTVSLPSSVAAAATVKEKPVGWTPYLLPSPAPQNIAELERCKGKVYAVGTATAIARGSATYTRSHAFSFSAKTGAMSSWAPKVDGPVQSIAFSPDCRTAYLGGTFSQVNTVAARNLVAVSTATGAVKRRFGHTVDGPVSTVRYAHGAVLIGGRFTTVNGVARTAMASLDPETGAVTKYLRVRIRGQLGQSATQVFNSQLSHDKHRLLIEGTFTSINDTTRQQAAVLKLGRSAVRLDGWTSPELLASCEIGFYVRAGNWSPDDKTIYLAATGLWPSSGPGSGPNQPRAGLCDAVSAFPAAARSVHHTWVNYSGCDSFYAVAADKSNVYVGGHPRWLHDSNGCNTKGPGAVSRPGIGSINPRTGRATSWNPTHSRGRGVDQLLVTKAGLWVASDTFTDGSAQQCGGVKHHGGICFFPY